MNRAEKLISVIQKIAGNLRELKEKEIDNMNLQDFTFAYFRYLEAVNKQGNPTFIELTEKLQLSKPTVTIMINKLIDKGLISKERSREDGRIYNLSLSEKGKHIVETYNAIYEKYINQIANRFNDKEMEILISLLERM